jgi:uncharacterized protein with HEPN domain
VPRDPRTYLWDAITAADLLASFAAGKTFVHYEADALTGQLTPVPLSGE